MTENWIIALFAFAGLMIFVVVAAIVASAMRSKEQPLPPSLDQTPEQKLPPPSEPDRKLFEATSPKPELVPVVPQPTQLKSALSKTHDQIFGRLRDIFRGDENSEVWDDIEEVLYTSDMGPQTVADILDQMKKDLSRSEKKSFQIVQETLITKINELMGSENTAQASLLEKIKASEKPFVVMVVGVNGAGKTTTIGKLSAQLAQNGLKVLIAAGDTFRAAATEQLKVWSDRAQVEIFTGAGGDPSGVAFDAVAKAKSKQFDVVILDTAGRLHNQTNLMEELKKVKRVIQKQMPSAPHETFIVLDANSGQNALIQAKQFNEALSLTGAVLTKMDGSAKGGIAIGVMSEVKIPIKYLGVGEKIEDLKPFDKQEFIESLVQR